jgi:hypothetical protein
MRSSRHSSSSAALRGRGPGVGAPDLLASPSPGVAEKSAAPPAGATDQTVGAVGLHVAMTARADLGRVSAAFGRPEADWLGQRVQAGTPEIRSFSCDLELSVGPERRALFRKSAIVGLGSPARKNGDWLVPIEWRAATLAPLFPVFAGQLWITADHIELDGHYAPPGGKIGYVLDRALLRIAARGTARWFLRKVVSVLDVQATP